MSTSNHETKTAFWAMVSRDLLVQWRDHNEFIFRVAMLPLILIVVYGFMLPTVGLLPAEFPTHMFCGMIGMSMLITGIHGTAVPISMDFHNLREIEDRLLAPVSSRTVAYAKMTVGVLESFVGGLIIRRQRQMCIRDSPCSGPSSHGVCFCCYGTPCGDHHQTLPDCRHVPRFSHACCFFGKHLLYLAPASAPSCHAGYNAHRSLDLDQ